MSYFSIASAGHSLIETVPPLENGDRLDQPTFLERYEAMSEDFRAELIGGIVYVASPQKVPHSRTATLVGHWLGAYEEETLGTQVLAGPSDILGSESMPEPDHCLLILPEYGGQTRINEKDYLVGAPELIVEVASTTESRDLHQKKADYDSGGVREYVVVALHSRKVFWFVRRGSRLAVSKAGENGIFRSRVFPGLWLDPDALLRGDRRALFTLARKGLASDEHEAFVKKLSSRRR